MKTAKTVKPSKLVSLTTSLEAQGFTILPAGVKRLVNVEKANMVTNRLRAQNGLPRLVGEWTVRPAADVHDRTDCLEVQILGPVVARMDYNNPLPCTGSGEAWLETEAAIAIKTSA